MQRSLVVLLGCCTWLFAGAAAAQSINDIPSPDEIRNAESAQLQIEWPRDGDAVKVPFTMTGVAEPGARLELWLGGELERVFIADANGRFSTAVSRTVEGPIELHQVDGDGERVRSTQVSVAFVGAAAPLPPPPKDGSLDQADPAETTSDDVIDPFADVPQEKTSSALPRVSELDGAASAGNAAPVPPPPSATSAGFDDEPTPAPAAASSNDVVIEQPVERRPNTPSRVARYFGEVGLGLAGAATIGFGGVLVGAGVGFASGDPFAAIGLGAIGGLLGWVIGLPVGVVLGGNMMDGNGKWWAAIIGEVAGFALAAPLVSAYSQNNFDATVPLVLLAVLPALGSAGGYELTSDRSAWESRQQARVRWTPSIGRTRNGEATVGFRLTY